MKKIIAGAVLLTPFLALAQQSFGGVASWVRGIESIVALLIPIAAALALLYFFWGLGKFILNAGNEEAREAGKHMMIWGIVALFIIASIWGIIEFLGRQLNITEQGGTIDVPGVRGIN